MDGWSEVGAIRKLLVDIDSAEGYGRMYDGNYVGVTASDISKMRRDRFERLHETLRVAELYRATAPFSAGDGPKQKPRFAHRGETAYPWNSLDMCSQGEPDELCVKALREILFPEVKPDELYFY